MSVKVLKNDWKDVEVRFSRNIRGGIKRVSYSVLSEVVGGIVSERMVDTGNYLRSWAARFSPDGHEGIVGSPVEYGPYLEFGTRYMPARPHVMPAAEKVGKRLRSQFRDLGR